MQPEWPGPGPGSTTNSVGRNVRGFLCFFSESFNDSRLPGLAFANHHHSLPLPVGSLHSSEELRSQTDGN